MSSNSGGLILFLLVAVVSTVLYLVYVNANKPPNLPARAPVIKKSSTSTSTKPPIVNTPPVTPSGGVDITKVFTDPVTYLTIGIQMTMSAILSELKPEGGVFTKIRKYINDTLAEEKIKTVTSNPDKVKSFDATGSEVETELRTLEGTGTKAVVHADEKAAMEAAIQTGENAGKRVVTQLAAAGETGPAAPFVEVAEMAFNMFTGYMDDLNLGGFQNMTNMAALNGTRDATFQAMVDEFDKHNMKFPAVYGPFDIINPDALTLIIAKKAGDMATVLVTPIINELFKQVPKPDPNPPNTDAFVNLVLDQLDIDNLIKIAYAQVCTENGGHSIGTDGACSFTEADCIPRWPMLAGDTYFEWNKTNSVCETRPSAMRTKCETLGMGVTYNPDTESCNITDTYCRRFGTDDGLVNGDCKISEAENIAETIFGTAFTRSIVNIFNPGNYKCPPGSHTPDELIALSALAGPFEPFIAAGLTAGVQTLCATDQCPAGQEKMMNVGNTGGLCYPNCYEGYSSKWGGSDDTHVGGMCYQNCPSWADTQTTEQCIRNVDIHDVSGDHHPSQCPPGSTATTSDIGGGQICAYYDSKTHFYQGGLVYPNSVKDYVDLAGNVMPTIQAIAQCPDPGHYAWDGTISPTACYNHCGNKDSLGTCHAYWEWPETSCPDGYTMDAGGALCQIRPGTVPTQRSALDVGVCPFGYVKPHGQGLCYPNCALKFGPSYHNVGSFCTKDYMAVGRDSYTREPTGSAYKIVPGIRDVPFPSTSDSDFKNSALGSHIQAGVNAARNGDVRGLFAAATAAAIVGDPAVNSLQLGPLANMGACIIDKTCPKS